MHRMDHPTYYLHFSASLSMSSTQGSTTIMVSLSTRQRARESQEGPPSTTSLNISSFCRSTQDPAQLCSLGRFYSFMSALLSDSLHTALAVLPPYFRPPSSQATSCFTLLPSNSSPNQQLPHKLLEGPSQNHLALRQMLYLPA
jgi:hypothetical protein